MKNYVRALIIVALLFIPTKINAASICNPGLLADYKSLAGNINITYSYKLEKGKPIFEVTISNLYNDMYVVDKLTKKTYDKADFNSNNELIIGGYRENSKIRYEIYTRVAGCYGKLLTIRYVTFPNYNEFSTDEICVGAEEFSLCKRWGAVAVDYETFVKEVKKYKEKKAEKKPIIFEKEETFLEKMFAFVGEYYIYLVSFAIALVLLVAVLSRRRYKRNQFDFKV